MKLFPRALLAAALGCWSLPAFASSDDASLNQESIPPTGFTCTVQLQANFQRGIVEIENRSTDAIKIILDDGSDAAGHASILSLSPAPASGQAGQAWSDPNFKGRVQVCVPTGNAGTDIAMVRED